jgi:hypothetical protein
MGGNSIGFDQIFRVGVRGHSKPRFLKFKNALIMENQGGSVKFLS